MITFVIGLLTGWVLAILMISILAISSRDEPKCLGKKDVSVNLRSEIFSTEKGYGKSQGVV